MLLADGNGSVVDSIVVSPTIEATPTAVIETITAAPRPTPVVKGTQWWASPMTWVIITVLVVAAVVYYLKRVK